MTDDAMNADTVTHTTEIVASYVANNAVEAGALPALIAEVHAALTRVSRGEVQAPEPEPLKPPVPIKKSITPDYLISLEDGRQYKSLKRHLAGRGLTPGDYRAKWGLGSDYPMVAPNYSAARSALAKAAGLGNQRRKAAPDAPAPKAAGRKKAGADA